MSNVPIATYQVVTEQNINGSILRHLYLEAEISSPGDFKHFAIYFTEQASTNLGYVNPSNGYVVSFLPLRDFADMYNIVQNEKRVYANWYADSTNKLQWFQIGTNPDPVGEGLVDSSPFAMTNQKN